jgi:hypothetical protein
MPDLVVTVPKNLWFSWVAEGDLPGEPWSGYESHFWISRDTLPVLGVGDRLYIVAHGRLRGFAPVTGMEEQCRLAPARACIMRRGDAQAVTIGTSIRGFRGWQYRWWYRADEHPFPDWRTSGVTPARAGMATGG